MNTPAPKDSSVAIAQRLEHLFAQTAGPQGRPVTLQEIIDRMERRGISTMSLSYLQQLRSGQAHNPRLQHLRALADAFDVPLTYFLDEDDDRDEDGTTGVNAPSDLTPEEKTVALRVHGLSPEALASIRTIIDVVRKGEALDDPDSESRQ